MLEKKYEVYELADGSKHLNVIFDDEKYDLLTIFLVVEVNAFRKWIKESFDKVISGRVQYEKFGGNICYTEITPDITTIYNSLSDDDEQCEVNTLELRQLIDEWCDKVDEFKRTQRLS